MTSIESFRPPATPLGTPDMSQGVKRSLSSDMATSVKTLNDYFGFGAFKASQAEVIEEALKGRDVAVFWATGSGKSICYQLPALHLGSTVFVVSPLISLMVDQVTKFNATAGAAPNRPRACFLGTAQFDPQVEDDAFQGKYSLVYVTPEKLTSCVNRIKTLHSQGKIALLAVDEAHCISEWGHDFRPSYREIKCIREVIPGLPIMTLTATAVPRVQKDILAQMGLRNPLVSQNSVDRPNLKISCSRKQNKAADLWRIARLAMEGGSTIVYCPTQAETESAAAFLKDKLEAKGINVGCYHGGMTHGSRDAAHLNFLSGQCPVICATVAFGMGIDKPDIRRIVHLGPPKTVEEYFQQIGRAGRDGLTASCELLSNDADFNNYCSEFYTKNLTGAAKEQQLKSTEALRGFASSCSCRRRWLLQYFGEVPAFGDRCGTCDICISNEAHKQDLERDFAAPASCVLEAVAASEGYPLAITKLMEIIGGTFKPQFARDQIKVEARERIKIIKSGLPPVMRREAFMKEMFSLLTEHAYLKREKKSAAVGQGSYVNTFDVYLTTEKGMKALSSRAEIRLPVMQSIRQQEEEEKRKLEAKKQELVKAGVDLKKIPQKELESGEGKTIDAQLAWIRRLEHFRQRGQEAKATKLQEVYSRIVAWRDKVALSLRMAPASVLSDALITSIAYTQPTSVDALKGAGVRIVNVQELADLMKNSVQELLPQDATAESQGAAGGPAPAQMILPDGIWQAPMKWPKAVYKVAKNGALPAWEQYYNRWAKGENPQAIAMNPPSGKAVQVSTVLGHCMTAMLHAKQVHLRGLCEQCNKSPPNEEEWKQIEEAAAVRNQNVDADDYSSKEVLAGILGPENVNVESTDKTDEQKDKEKVWYECIRWWEALRRARFPVQFETAEQVAKRQKVA